MRKFKVPASRICRHYDVSRKDCPHNFRANNWAQWWQFKEEIKAPIEWAIDLSKSSEFGPQARAGGPLAEVTDVEDLKARDKARKEHLMTQKLIRITSPSGRRQSGKKRRNLESPMEPVPVPWRHGRKLRRCW